MQNSEAITLDVSATSAGSQSCISAERARYKLPSRGRVQRAPARHWSSATRAVGADTVAHPGAGDSPSCQNKDAGISIRIGVFTGAWWNESHAAAAAGGACVWHICWRDRRNVRRHRPDFVTPSTQPPPSAASTIHCWHLVNSTVCLSQVLLCRSSTLSYPLEVAFFTSNFI